MIVSGSSIAIKERIYSNFFNNSRLFKAVFFLTVGRLPVKRNLLQIFLFPLSMAIKTVPMGFSGEPPVGPAIPVIPIPKSVLANLRTFCANLEATIEETAPFWAIREEGIFRIPDDKIIRMAKDEDRTIITFDKHFGNVMKYPPSNAAGIIHIRIHPPLLPDIISAMDNLFKKYEFPSFSGKLIVLSKSGYRVRV